MYSRRERDENGRVSSSSSNHLDNDRLRVKGRRSGYDSPEMTSPNRSGSTSPATSSLSSPSMSPKLGRAAGSRLVSGSVSSHWITDPKSRASMGGVSPRKRAPGFILRPRPQTVATGEKLVLKCTLLGHPTPTVTWERDGRKIEDGGRTLIRESGNDFFLEISDTTSSDAGKYTVQAKNSLGKQSATVDIVITGDSGSGKSRVSNAPQGGSNVNEKTNHTSSVAGRKDVTSKTEITISKPAKSNSYVSSYSSRTTVTSRSTTQPDDSSSSYRSRKSNQVSPTFTRRLSSIQILEGEDLKLHCEVAGNPEPEMTWYKNGVKISKYDSSIKLSFVDGVAKLNLNQIKPSDAGEYQCMATNSIGEAKCSSRVTVKAKQKQEKPRFVSPPKDVRIEEGDTLTLEAEVSGKPVPEVHWSLDGEEISDGEITFRNNIAKLVLRDVSLERSGQYMCTLMNEVGEDSAACRVRIRMKKVNVAPEFTAPLSDIKTNEGEDISLRCMVTGIPEPEVDWLLNEEKVVPGDGFDISFRSGVAILALNQVTPEDTGCYTCIATNSAGKSSTSCQLVVSEHQEEEEEVPDVEFAPEFVSTFENYVRAVEGDTVQLECNVTGSPQPEVTWTIGGRPPRGARITFENGLAAMTIESVTSEHGGDVACVAKNAVGKIKHEGRLYIRAKREAPSFVTELPETVEVQEGKEVTFGCQIKGHPQPRVSWSRNGRNLSVLNTETAYEEGKASVRIRKAGNSDGGKYVCTARNLSGETESSCLVTVVKKHQGEKPDFVQLLSDLSLEDGQDIRLECKVTGKPEPQITWILDGQKLEAEDGDASFKDGVARMVLEDAMAEDSGIYECVAKNSEGETKTSCKVVVSAKKPTEEGPSFPIQLEDMTIKENDDILLKCKVSGNPRPTITWLLDGESIPEAECKYDENGEAELFLPDALPEDEGVYTCIAQNKMNRVMCSCKVTVTAHPKVSKRKPVEQVKKEVQRPEPKYEKSTPAPRPTAPVNGEKEYHVRKVSSDDAFEEPARGGPDRPPKFVEKLTDKIVPDGSINYKLVVRVSGMPPPNVKWYVNEQEIEDGDDFKYESDGDIRRLIFSEIFPDDTGNYVCVASNNAGEDRTSMKLEVEEIDGDPPNFITKPRPITINAGENALFTCKVDGEPVPTVQWLYCNQPIPESDHINIITPSADNNYTHSLEVCEARNTDAGRYAACCRNLLGDVTCTVSLIVNAPKNQEEQTDFRKVLKPSLSKTKSPEPSSAEQLDFRGLLKRADPTSPEPVSKTEDNPDFRDVLSRPVHTKVLSEDERKNLRADQKDFRATLVRKVDTKNVTPEHLKTKGPEQKDFRGEALKTKVHTKAYQEESIKLKQPEQLDFRGEALKTKVVTKAYKEENIKNKRVEQVDFREVLSPTKRQTSKDEASTEASRAFELPSTPAKMKINKEKMDHTTVSTKRSRGRGGDGATRRTRGAQPEASKGNAPEFSKRMRDVKVNDSEPFSLTCHVMGHPRPKVSWFFGEEEVQTDADITITHEDDVCTLSVAESFPADEGTYICRAENEHGAIQCSAHVTVVADGELACEPDS